MVEMEIPDKVARVQLYARLKNERVELEKKIKSIRKRLSDMENELSSLCSREQEALSLADCSMLIDRRSVNTINGLLASAVSVRTRQGELPVGCTVAQLNKDKLHLFIVFSQPIFSGWRTETPYVSYQICPLQPDTPELPDSNYIPRYTSLLEMDIALPAVWEQVDNELRLWEPGESYVVVFTLSKVGS
ncbi:MAG: hypothetical protein M0R06_22660 [Sphaerochaeta sp.]|jgi:hypothetical protein|nr:hypothetical protein [Sphaerochaeta sp.]